MQFFVERPASSRNIEGWALSTPQAGQRFMDRTSLASKASLILRGHLSGAAMRRETSEEVIAPGNAFAAAFLELNLRQGPPTLRNSHAFRESFSSSSSEDSANKSSMLCNGAPSEPFSGDRYRPVRPASGLSGCWLDLSMWFEGWGAGFGAEGSSRSKS